MKTKEDQLKELDRIIGEIHQMFGPNKLPVRPNPKMESYLKTMQRIRGEFK